jgi:hypothetical protein
VDCHVICGLNLFLCDGRLTIRAGALSVLWGMEPLWTVLISAVGHGTVVDCFNICAVGSGAVVDCFLSVLWAMEPLWTVLVSAK